MLVPIRKFFSHAMSGNNSVIDALRVVSPIPPDLGFINRKDIENNETTKEFFDYVLSFYGKGGLYDFGAVIDDIITATQIYINKTITKNNQFYTWGYGDSLDRERVRDILLDEDIFGYEWKTNAKLHLDLTN